MSINSIREVVTILTAEVGFDGSKFHQGLKTVTDHLKKFDSDVRVLTRDLPSSVRKGMERRLEKIGKDVETATPTQFLKALKGGMSFAANRKAFLAAKRKQETEAKAAEQIAADQADTERRLREQQARWRARAARGQAGFSDIMEREQFLFGIPEEHPDHPKNVAKRKANAKKRRAAKDKADRQAAKQQQRQDAALQTASDPANWSDAQRKYGTRMGSYYDQWFQERKAGNLGALSPQERMVQELLRKENEAENRVLSGQAADEKERVRKIQARQRLNRMRNRARVQREKEREARRAEQQRQANRNKWSGWATSSISGASAFMGGMIGSAISAAHLPGPFQHAFTGMAGGMSMGTAIGGMFGGPVGALGGGAIGALGGGLLGGAIGIVDSAMSLLFAGVSKAMHVIEKGAVEILHLGMDYERQMAKFEILAGSKEAGATLYSGLEKMSMTSPYKLSQLSAPAELLLGYGASSQNALGIVQRLGDVAGGDPVRMERLALAAGQVMSQGRLQGQELRQFAEAGVGAADFAATYGKPVADLRHDMELGIVPASVMLRTIERLTNEGGRFFGMMDRTARTTEGRWNALVGTLEKVGRRFGEGALNKSGIASGIAGVTEKLVDFFSPERIETMSKGVADFGKELWRAVEPTVNYLKDWGTDFSKMFFGDTEMTWGKFSALLLSTFREVGDITTKVANALKEDIFPILIGVGAKVVNGMNWLGRNAEDIGWLASPSTMLAMKAFGLDPKGLKDKGEDVLANLGGGMGDPRKKTTQEQWAAIALGGKVGGELDPFRTLKDLGLKNRVAFDELERAIGKRDAESKGSMGYVTAQRWVNEADAKWKKASADYWMMKNLVDDTVRNAPPDWVGPENLGNMSLAGPGGTVFGKGWAGKALKREDIETPNTPADRMMKDVFDDLKKDRTKGITAFDKFNNTMDMARRASTPGVEGLKEVRLGVQDAMTSVLGGLSGGMNFGLGNVQPPDVVEALKMKAYKELSDSVDLEKSVFLPSSAARDTQESIKIINEQSLKRQEVSLDTINATLEAAKKESTKYYEDMKTVIKFFSDKPQPLSIK